jgi:hypothetical protein
MKSPDDSTKLSNETSLESIKTIEELEQKIELIKQKIDDGKSRVEKAHESIIDNQIEGQKDIFENIRNIKNIQFEDQHLHARKERLLNKYLKLLAEEKGLSEYKTNLDKNN